MLAMFELYIGTINNKIYRVFDKSLNDFEEDFSCCLYISLGFCFCSGE